MNFQVFFLGALLGACTGTPPVAPAPVESVSTRQPQAQAAPSIVVAPVPLVASVLASYETQVGVVEKRQTNVRLAASKINGHVLAPGATFSFNGVVGPRTKEAGFQEAPEFLAGVKVDGVGGGVCQVSSTLYGVARRGWLTVVRRYAHSRPVTYTPTGTDAAVAYGELDLVLVNPYDVPLTFRAGLDGNTLRMVIEGLPADFEVVHRYAAHHPVAPPRREIPSKYLTQEKRFQAGKEGISGTSTWVKKQNGVEVDRVVSISRYQPVPEVWFVPTTPASSSEVPQ